MGRKEQRTGLHEWGGRERKTGARGRKGKGGNWEAVVGRRERGRGKKRETQRERENATEREREGEKERRRKGERERTREREQETGKETEKAQARETDKEQPGEGEREREKERGRKREGERENLHHDGGINKTNVVFSCANVAASTEHRTHLRKLLRHHHHLRRARLVCLLCVHRARRVLQRAQGCLYVCHKPRHCIAQYTS